MAALYQDRSALLQRLLVALATTLALLLLALVLARWTWALLAPPAAASAPAAPDTAVVLVAAPALFGVAPAPGADATRSTLAITLLGTVVATPGRRGHALVRLGEQASLVVREGEVLAPGITLVRVGPDQIVLERGGARETLAWPRLSTLTPALLSGADQ